MTTEATLSQKQDQMGLNLPPLEVGFREIIEKPIAILSGAVAMVAGVGAAGYSLTRAEKADAVVPQYYGSSPNVVKLPSQILGCPNYHNDAPRMTESNPTYTAKDIAIKYQPRTSEDRPWVQYGYGCVGAKSSAYVQLNNGTDISKNVRVSVLPTRNESKSLFLPTVTRQNSDGTSVDINCATVDTKLDCNIGDLQSGEQAQLKLSYSSVRPAAEQAFSVEATTESGDDNMLNNTTEIVTDVHPKQVDFHNKPTIGFSRYIKKTKNCGVVNIVTKAKPDNDLYDAKVTFFAFKHTYYRGKRAIQNRRTSEVTPKGFKVPVRVCKADNKSTLSIDVFAGNLHYDVSVSGLYKWNHPTKKFKRIR